MNLTIDSGAEEDFETAVQFYESRQLGLGDDFTVEVYLAIERILEFPFGWPILEGELRRCFTRRFPYAVVYVVKDQTIHIVAIMHLKRRPGYWEDRKKQN